MGLRMARWYRKAKGGLQGPLSHEAVCRFIVKKKIKPLDLLLKEGKWKWECLEEIEEFQDCLYPYEFKAKKWVTICQGQKKHPQGPFSVQEIIKMLRQGKLRWLDYGWYPGMSSWRPLFHFVEQWSYFFNIKEVLDGVKKEKQSRWCWSQEELLSQIVQQKETLLEKRKRLEKQKSQKKEPIPEGTDGKELVEQYQKST